MYGIKCLYYMKKNTLVQKQVVIVQFYFAYYLKKYQFCILLKCRWLNRRHLIHNIVYLFKKCKMQQFETNQRQGININTISMLYTWIYAISFL